MAKKFLLGLAVCLCMLIGTNAWAGDYTYTESGGEITITEYIGSGGDVVIPDTIEGMPVVSIGDSAFDSCYDLISVIIGNNVASIGKEAFAHCIRLSSMTIPDSVTSIGEYAFFGCEDLTNVTISDSVTRIESYTFSQCGLTSVTIPNSVTSIGEMAFAACSDLIGVTIGNSVISIGAYAFAYCYGLTNVAIGNSVTRIEVAAFHYCGNLISVNIPDSVASIGEEAFYACDSLTSLTLGNSVIHIGAYAFGRCESLTNVTIPDSVRGIGDKAFSSCFSLVTASFLGLSPGMGSEVFHDTSPYFSICYTSEAEGFTTPTWEGYPAADCMCSYDNDCDIGVCSNNVCAECVVDADCANNAPYCVDETNICVDCTQDPDCDRGTCINNVCSVDGSFQIEKFTVKAGKNGKGDCIKFSGFLDAIEADFDAAMGGNIIVIIFAEDIPDLGVTTYAFPIEEDYIKKSAYKSPKVKPMDIGDSVASLQIDTIQGTIKFSGRRLDLTGLACPIFVKIEIGNYSAVIVVDEDIVNGPKKPCPPELMEGI